jgi:hypothetical protein
VLLKLSPRLLEGVGIWVLSDMLEGKRSRLEDVVEGVGLMKYSYGFVGFW